jgi:peptide/nickel transport system substrate-binding protein/oligopeptide transport system substrate-binding protein
MKALRIITFLLIATLILTACQPKEAETPAPATEAPMPVVTTAPVVTEAVQTNCPKVGGVLVSSLSSDPKNIDPATLSAWDQTVIAPNLLEGLFRLSPDGTLIENALASEYSISDNALVWTFTIREGAMFHNGRVVTAGDFKYSFERVLDPKTQSPRAWMLKNISGATEFFEGKVTEVSGIKAVDDKTLEITLVEPSAPFKSMLASPSLAVVPQEEVEKWGADFGFHVVAAGPFKIGEWNVNQDLTIDAFNDYWNGRPCVDAVKFRFIGDENTRILEFDAKSLDIAWVPPAQWDRFYNDPVYKEKLGWAHTFHTDFIAVNLEKEPFGNNPMVREAVRYALDMDAIIISLQNRATVAQGMLAPGMLAYDDKAILYYPRDVTKAKALMEEAGFKDGIPGSFDLILPNWGNLISMMQIYQQNLEEIGITININPMDYGLYAEAMDSGNYDLAWMYRVPDYVDPDGFYYPLLYSGNIGSGGNWARYSDATVDAKILEARALSDDASREALYNEIEKTFVEALPYIPLTHNIYVDLSQTYVMNYQPSPVDASQYQLVWLDK